MILKNDLITDEDYSSIRPDLDRKVSASIDIDSFLEVITDIFYEAFNDFDIKEFSVDTDSIYISGTEHDVLPFSTNGDDLDKMIREKLSKLDINKYIFLRYVDFE